MTRTLPAAALALSLVLGLAACGDDGGGAASGDLPTVTGEFGETPELTVPDADPPTTLETEVLSAGDGAQVESGDLLVVDYLGQTWDGDEPFDSSFERDQPASFSIGVGGVISGWDEALVGQDVGSRLLLVIPPDLGYGDTPPADSGIDAGDTLVFVVDIIDAVAPDASAGGEATPVDDPGLPEVSTEEGEPTVSIPDTDPPKTLVSEAVVTGLADPVESGQLLVVQYVGKVWRTGKTFDSSWQRGSPVGFPIGVGAVIPGWDAGLVGQPVGSRVLLVIPARQAYGDTPPPDSGIKPGDTLVFAVDILGAY